MLADARARQSVAGTAKDVADTAVQDARRRRTITHEVEQLRSQRDAVEADATNVQRARVELENSCRALTIKPRLEAFRDAATKMASAQAAHQTAIGAEEAGIEGQEGRQRSARKAASMRHVSVTTCHYACDGWTRSRATSNVVPTWSARLQSMPQQLEAADAAAPRLARSGFRRTPEGARRGESASGSENRSRVGRL